MPRDKGRERERHAAAQVRRAEKEQQQAVCSKRIRIGVVSALVLLLVVALLAIPPFMGQSTNSN